jgi:aminodeoxychorismate lyase
MLVFMNGQIVPEEQAMVSVFDRGFLYGDGLFETIPVYGGRPFRWAQHLERLTRGAEFLNISLPYSPKELRKFAAELIERNQQPGGLVRLNVSRGTGPRGYSPKGADSPVVVMTLHPPATAEPQSPIRWRLVTSAYRLPTTDPLASFKTTNKLLQIIVRAEAEAADADDALLLNTNGEVAETSRANVFWVYRDTIYATPSGRGALPGITRAVVLELCQALALPTNKKVIKPESLRNSEAIFLTLSSLGIVSVSSLDGEPINDSPLVDKLRQAYWEATAKG